MRMLKNLLKKLPPNIYYNILTSHDVLQGTIWRRTAPAVDDAAFREKYKTLFVVGCGRSGTTIFSHCLGKHRDVVELNEPLHIWFATDMKADIISPFAGLLRGRCRFDRHDANEKARARYRAVVDYHVDGRAPVICDKLPLNTFRVDYVEAIHPNLIARHGRLPGPSNNVSNGTAFGGASMMSNGGRFVVMPKPAPSSENSSRLRLMTIIVA